MKRTAGDFMFSALVRTEALSVCSAIYTFTEKIGSRARALPRPARCEFRWMVSVLPLLGADLAKPWAAPLIASDAEGASRTRTGGYGMMTKGVGAKVAKKVGELSEAWRFGVVEGVFAHADTVAKATSAHAEALVLCLTLPEINSSRGATHSEHKADDR